MSPMISTEIEKEKGVIEKMEEAIKSALFKMCFILNKNSESPFWKAVLLHVVELVQLISFPLSTTIGLQWKIPWAETIQTIPHTLKIGYWLNKYGSQFAFLALMYLCMATIIVFIILIFSIYLLSSKKRARQLQIAKLVRNYLECMCFIFMIPFIELFLSPASCTQSSSSSFSDNNCWAGLNIFHGFIGIFFSLILAAITFLAVLLAFSHSDSPADSLGRVSSSNSIIINAHKIANAALFTLLVGTKYTWLLTAYLLICSLILFLKHLFTNQYYYLPTVRLTFICYSLYFWTCIVEFICLITQNTSFSGAIEMMLIGWPLVVIVCFFVPLRRYKVLFTDPSKLERPEMVLIHIRLLIELMIKKERGDKQSGTLLNGYIYSHEESCVNSECSLKILVQLMAGNKDKKKNTDIMTPEQIQLLLTYLNKLYVQSLTKFPKYMPLRLSYAFLLLEKVGNQNMAISELLIAEKFPMTLEEEFLTYLLRKKIEDEINDYSNVGVSNNAATIDAMSMIAYENCFKQMKDSIIRVAFFHIKFWNLLLEDEPDMQKIYRTGVNISVAIIEVEELWTKLQKIYSNVAKSIKLYADYLQDILNDREGSQALMAHLKEVAITRAPLTGIGSNQGANTSEDVPCIVASGDHEKIGEIINFNMSLCRIFGYTKMELATKNIDTLMPEIYSSVHFESIKRALNRNSKDPINFDKFIVGRHKSGYVIPLWKQVKSVSSISEGVQFIATFKLDKKLYNSHVGYLLCDPQKNISSISSTCILLLGVNNKTIRSCKVSMQLLSPDMFRAEMEQTYKSENGGIAEIFLPDTSIDFNNANELDKSVEMHIGFGQIDEAGQASKLRIVPSKRSEKFTCMIADVVLQNDQLVGHIIRIEHEPVKSPNRLLKSNKSSQFKITFDITHLKFVRTCENVCPDEKASGVLQEKDRAILYDSIPSAVLEQIKERNEKVMKRLNKAKVVDALGLLILDQNKGVAPPKTSRKSGSINIKKESDIKSRATSHGKQKTPSKLKDEEGEDFDEDSKFEYEEDEQELEGDEEYDSKGEYEEEEEEEEEEENEDDYEYEYEEEDDKASSNSKQSKASKASKVSRQSKNTKPKSKSMLNAPALKNIPFDESKQSGTHSIQKDSARSKSKDPTTPRDEKSREQAASKDDVSSHKGVAQSRKSFATSSKGRQPKTYLSENKPKEKNIFAIRKNINYADGINTFQIRDNSSGFMEVVGGKNSDIAKRDQEQKDKEDNKEEQVAHQNNANPFKSSIKSRKAMAMVLKNKFIPLSITRLRLVFHAIIIAILILGSVQYFYDIIKFEGLLINMDLIYKSSKMADIFSKCVIITLQIAYTNQYSPLSYFNMTEKIIELRRLINESYDIQKYIGLSNIQTTTAHEQSSKDKNIKVLFPDQNLNSYTSQYYTIEESISHVLSTLYTIQSLDSKLIVQNETDVIMLSLNVFGYVYDGVTQEIAYYSDDMNYTLNQLSKFVEIMLICISIVIAISIGVMVSLFLIIVWHREKTISFFLEIPIRNLRQLYKKCEKYINNIQDDQGGEDDSSNGSDSTTGANNVKKPVLKTSNNIDYEYGRITSTHKRKFRKDAAVTLKLSMIYAAIAIFLECYGVATYYLSYSHLHQSYSYRNELGSIVGSTPLYTKEHSYLVDWIINSRSLVHLGIINSSDYNSLFQTEINNIYTEYGKILDGHKQREQELNSEYNSIFLELMTSNACNYSKQLNFQFDCLSFMNSILQQGLHSTEIIIGEIFRHRYEASLRTTGTLIPMMAHNEFRQLDYLTFQVLNLTYSYIIDELITSYVNKYSSISKTKLSLYVGFFIITALGYLIAWVPFIAKHVNDILKAKKMFVLIPIEIIQGLKGLQSYLNHEGNMSVKSK